MEKLKVISITIPFGDYVSIEKTDYMDDLNQKLDTWVKLSKLKSYRIINVAVQEVAHKKVTLYSMFIAYEE